MTAIHSEKHSWRSIELFSGAGGLAVATHLAGFHHEGLFEWNVDACATLATNARRSSIPGMNAWERVLVPGDVAVQSFEKFGGIDLVAGGPPCQPFSLGGKHSGMNDRRDMIPQFIRSVREARPRAFMMENVRGLARRSFATYLQYSVLQLRFPELQIKPDETWSQHLVRLEQHSTSRKRSKGLEYNVLVQVLNAANFGVPQSRERIFIVGFRSDINAKWAFPQPTHSLDSLLYRQHVTGEYWERLGMRPQEMPGQYIRKAKAMRSGPPPVLSPWRSIRESTIDLPAPFVGFDNSDSVFNHRLQLGARPYPGHTGSPIDYPSKTLKAGDHGVPGGENMIDFRDGTYRYLTIREAARVQTFPDTWKFEGPWSEAMRQLGNAVPIELAKVVASSIGHSLGQADS